MKSPHQQLFDQVVILCREVTDNVYPYLPQKDVGYPLVIVGEQHDSDRYNKSRTYGRITQRVHVYHYIAKRNDADHITREITKRLRALTHTEGYYLRLNESHVRVMTDQTTPTPLWHFVIEVTYTFQ